MTTEVAMNRMSEGNTFYGRKLHITSYVATPFLCGRSSPHRILSALAILAGGSMRNKTLQKLRGTNAVIGFSSGLISVKLSATEIDFVPGPFRYYMRLILYQALFASRSSNSTLTSP